VSDDVRPSGHVVVYRDTGTPLIVGTDEVLAFDAADDDQHDQTRGGDDEMETPQMTELSERLHVDVQMICELSDGGVEVDGEAVLADGPKWVIYGRTTYDGEVILAEYDDPEEAEAVIRSLPEHVLRSRS
jgi:hypothetical protein